ncbi:YwpF family protein [Virgibacillus salinus]|uniref:YwpF-like protein n=1 Tax=Virgibacillus salinus TaxID=553311 RepID=A0A1H1CPQ6_9BACI|nr:YwpF family protein [Virgibacillus salinus]SDQ65526.1 YwpF-like protein [Virgibacillus salinus]
MKTFKLASLEILDSQETNMVQQSFPLLDGLVINREDEQNRWVIEAYLLHKYYTFFQKLKEKQEEVLIQVKISKESNEPATFITSLIGINEIGAHMNVLLRGTIVDQRKSIVEDKLKSLIDEGYSGEELLIKFKEDI